MISGNAAVSYAANAGIVVSYIEKNCFEDITMEISGIIFQEESQHDQGYFISNYFDYKHEVLFYLKTLLVKAKQKEQNWQSMCQCLFKALIINLIRRSHMFGKNELKNLNSY